ncbi:Macrophage infectivity potentiator-related protein [Neisseria gonorrhoeae]|uniref:Macrophage infectivity potentiator-related protein n=1 Tax=Neisseria gonorrhoeae TaxID=485 RepID=A0A378VVW7_NEIGO|nr:Macrophage infectivity potentiator-related protein [Neisseria gonorrhoeae]
MPSERLQAAFLITFCLWHSLSYSVPKCVPCARPQYLRTRKENGTFNRTHPRNRPEAAKPRVAAVLQNNGFIPNLIGVLANAPEALAFYQEVGKLNAANSLTAGEVEVIQIIAARTNQCGFCVAGHTKLATLKNSCPSNPSMPPALWRQVNLTMPNSARLPPSPKP